jgi:hypothetical protein
MAMKNLVLASLICGVAAQLGTGCIIVGDDDNNNPPPPPPPDAPPPPPPDAPPPGPGEFLVSWTLLAGEAQSSVPCPPNGVDIRITVDPDPNVASDEDVYVYNCTDGEGFADGLPAGIYDVRVELLDADQNLLAESDIERAVDLDFEERVALDFTFSVDLARFALTWTITDLGELSSCEGVGADDVSLLLTVAGTTEADDFVFSCVAGQGVSDPLKISDAYVGKVSLLDNGEVIEDADAENLVLDWGNQIKDLGNFTFEL